MTVTMTASDRDLRTLARIVSDDRCDLPAQGLAPSLLSDLSDLIRCDCVAFAGLDSARQAHWFLQVAPVEADNGDDDTAFWAHYWNSSCSHADRTGDLRSVTKISDFYSARQWHSTGMYSDCLRDVEHEIVVCLPADPGPTAGPGRTLRLVFARGPGPDFSDRDRDLLTLLRPHLHQAYLDAERRRHGVPRLTRRHWSCCAWSPPGTPTARSPAGSACRKEPSASTCRTSTPGCTCRAAQPRSPAPSQTGLCKDCMS